MGKVHKFTFKNSSNIYPKKFSKNKITGGSKEVFRDELLPLKECIRVESLT